MTKLHLNLTILALTFAPQATAQDVVTYVDHVKPIFMQSCSNCHNPDRARGGLDLTSYTGTMAGGSAGEIVVSMDPSGSRLIGVMAHTLQPVMPPNGGKIADAKLELVRQWIAQGCRETSSSAAAVPSRPRVDLSVGEPTMGRPEGPPVMPWDMPLGPIHHAPRAGAVAEIAGHPWSPIVAVAGQQQVLIYHTQTNALLGVLPFAPGQPETISFPGAGRYMLVGGGVAGMSGSAVLYDVQTGQAIAQVGEEMDSVLTADLDALQRYVAVGGPSKLVKVFDLATGEQVHRIDKHTEWVTALGFSPDGILLATADRNGGLHVWEAESGQPFHALDGHQQQITDMAWRYDGNVLATCSEDGQVKLWEMHKGSQVKAWNAHNGGVQSVAFAEDGRLVTTGRDQRIKVWDVNGNLQKEIHPFADLGLSAAFDTTGTRVFAGDLSGKLVSWSLEADARQVVELTPNPPTGEMALVAVAEQQSLADAARAQAEQVLAENRESEQAATTALAGADAELNQARRTLAGAEQQLAQHEGQLAQARQRREQADAQLQQARANSEQMQQAMASATAEMNRVREEHDQEATQVNDLRAQHEQKQREAQAAAAQAEKAPEDEALRNRAAELVGQAQALAGQLAEQSAELERRADALCAAEAKHDEAKTAREQARQNTDRLTEQFRARRAEHDEMNTALNASRQAMVQAREQIKPAEDRQARARQAHQEAQAQRAQAEATLAVASAEVARAQQERAKWQSAQVRQDRDALADQLAEYRAAEHPLQQQIDEARTIRSGVATGLDNAKAELANGPQAMEQRNQRITALEQAAVLARQRVAEQQARAQELVQLLAIQRQSVVALTEQAGDAAAVEGPIQQALAQARAAETTLAAAQKNAQERAESLAIDAEDAAFDVESAQFALTKLQETLAALPERITEFEAELQSAAAIVAAAEQALAEARRPGDALEAKLAEVNLRYRALRDAAGFVAPAD